MKKNPLFLLILGLLILGGLGVTFVNKSTKTDKPDRPEIPKEQQKDLSDDFESINTIVYGVRGGKGSVVAGVNDSGKNNSPVSLLKSNTKFVYPLSNGRQLLYIDETNEYDMGKRFVIKNIIPDGTLDDGAEIPIYETSGDYRIDRYVISENNEWIAWYEVRPAFGTVPTHDSDYFKSYKANISDIVKNGARGAISAIQLTDEKSESGKKINFPLLITNSGSVYFDAVPPGSYALHSGFRDEQLNTILNADTYNSTPFLFSQRYLLYSAYDPNNSKFPDDGDKDSTRPSVLNTNIVKVYDIEKKVEETAAPGDAGEHYKHPVYVSGTPGSDLTIAAEVYKIEDVAGSKKLVAKEIQLITSSNGSFEKKTVTSMSDSSRLLILGVGELPNGNKTLLVGDESGTEGNFGTGNGISPSGYRSMVTSISVFDLSKLEKIGTVSSFTSSQFEYLGLLPKLTTEKIGIARNTKIDKETLERTKKQLQLGTFVPVQPKRERRNPRSECEDEWEKKGYPNYEACEACPIYVYSGGGIKDVSIRPLTAISESSSNMPLANGEWQFSADEKGLLYSNGKTYDKIDFYFPRASYEAPKEGWVIEQNSAASQMEEIARSIGFNFRETNDIVQYLTRNFGNQRFFLGVLETDQVRNLLNFEISPKPKITQTVLFYVKTLNQDQNIAPRPASVHFNRDEYSVITWGVVSE